MACFGSAGFGSAGKRGVAVCDRGVASSAAGAAGFCPSDRGGSLIGTGSGGRASPVMTANDPAGRTRGGWARRRPMGSNGCAWSCLAENSGRHKF